MTTIIILLCLGLIAGMLSGMVGIGGGIVIVPALVYFLGYTQHQAQGTVLFMFLLPIGILGVFNYYQAGYIEWRTALIIASTFLIGSYFGSKISIAIDQTTLKKVFGVIILLLSLKMIFGK
ncbi:MAG: sulfite exporter TauE/SafE family protein [Bacteroidetes bacterium]|nr:sulfite exporter TauE/SafE family protein [Bacteroidota bacterium]